MDLLHPYCSSEVAGKLFMFAWWLLVVGYPAYCQLSPYSIDAKPKSDWFLQTDLEGDTQSVINWPSRYSRMRGCQPCEPYLTRMTNPSLYGPLNHTTPKWGGGGVLNGVNLVFFTQVREPTFSDLLLIICTIHLPLSQIDFEITDFNLRRVQTVHNIVADD